MAEAEGPPFQHPCPAKPFPGPALAGAEIDQAQVLTIGALLVAELRFRVTAE